TGALGLEDAFGISSAGHGSGRSFERTNRLRGPLLVVGDDGVVGGRTVPNVGPTPGMLRLVYCGHFADEHGLALDDGLAESGGVWVVDPNGRRPLVTWASGQLVRVDEVRRVAGGVAPPTDGDRDVV